MTQVTLGPADNARRIALAPGDTLLLRLPENPTTGYRWTFQASGPLVPAGDDFLPSGGAAPGAGGERCLRWSAGAPGVARLSGVLARSWEAAGAPSAAFDVTVDVR